MFVDHDRVWEECEGCKAQDKVQFNPDALTQLKPSIIKTMCHEVSEDGVKSKQNLKDHRTRLYICWQWYCGETKGVRQKRREENNNTSNCQRINVMVKVFSQLYRMRWTIVNRLKEKSYKDVNHLCWSFLCSEMHLKIWSYFDDIQMEHYAASTLDSRNM